MRAARYMTRFRCLGGECEATCCAAFAVPADQATVVRLKLLGDEDVVAKELVEQAVELTPDGPDYGRLRFTEAGRCTMLEASGLCRIQARFGNEGLFEVCATYPRYFSRIDGAVELLGTLSCPEVARLALLADDAFEHDEQPLAQEPRKLRNRFDTEAPYYRPFHIVRAALLELLDAPGPALCEKLFALLWLADKLRGVLHDQCGPVPLDDLRAALAALREPQVLQQLGATFRKLPVDEGLALSVIAKVLGGSEQAGALAAEREAVPATTREQLDVFLTRYAKNHVLTTPYMLFADLFAYASDLVLKVALLRSQLQRRLAGFVGSREELERHVVEVVYQFVRRLEHTDTAARVRAELDAQGLNTLAHAVCFL